MKPAESCPARWGSVVPREPVQEADISQIWHLPLSFALNPLGSSERVHMSRLARKYAVSWGLRAGVD